jgi:YVTN family beta-propeller protein
MPPQTEGLPHRCVLLLIAAILAPLAGAGQDPISPVRAVPDPGVVTTEQKLTPAGLQSVFESRVYGVTFGGSDAEVYVSTSWKGSGAIFKLDWQANRVETLIKTAAAPGMQGLVFDTGRGSPLLSGISKLKEGTKTRSVVQLIAGGSDGNATVVGDGLGANAAGGVAVGGNGDHRLAVVALTFNDEAAVVDLATGKSKKIRTGIAPFGAVINRTGSVAFVSNWGGRFPRAGDRTAKTGVHEGADDVVTDQRGIASTGTVSQIDLHSGTVTAEIPVGLHPTSLAWDETRNRLYVANSNTDTISVIDTTTNRVVETISVQPFEKRAAGVAPEALVLSPDGTRLYAACAGINAVAVIAVGATGGNKIEGLIPTGWYPTHIALSPSGRYLAVSTLLGVGSGWKNMPVERFAGAYGKGLSISSRNRYVHSDRGSLHVIQIPDAARLADYTAAVAKNNSLRLRSGAESTRRTVSASRAKPIPVPLRAGDPSPIQHVVYIIKENRSYDQMFGDLGKGNGDRSLAIYGEDVAPNHRKLAREFVLLDNFYATGGNSGDGHQWVTQASETDYTYWPGYGGRSYPYDGTDPMAYANSGFIWNNVLNGNKTFEDFGEFAGTTATTNDRMKLLAEYKAGGEFSNRFQIHAPIAQLNKYLANDYPAWTLTVPDVVRAKILFAHLKEWEASGKMPNLVMVQLPSDHTYGTVPGFSTPQACIADNDWALGQIVDRISHSRFWKSTLILVVEDDAQAGLDHVDGHRTIALAVSPYVKRAAIDSSFYSQNSMVKTIELILGLPTMSMFDLIATDMRNSFREKPDYTPYEAVEPKYSIYETNPAMKGLTGQARVDAAASRKMNWRVPDSVPTEKLNRILWRQARGLNQRYPIWKQGRAVFTPSVSEEEDEDDER